MKNKLELVSTIMSEIFEPYQNYLYRLRKEMIQANAKVVSHDNAFLGFTFNYQQHTATGTAIHGAMPDLHPSLHSEFQSIIELMDTYARDWRQVNQGLSSLFARGETNQDFFDMLPDEVMEVLSYPTKEMYFRGLTRTRPEAYAIQAIPFQLDNFNKIKQTLYLYIGMHLIV